MFCLCSKSDHYHTINSPARGAIREKPYHLTKEELHYPAQQPGARKWYEDLVSRQLEGIEHGVRPQRPRNMSFESEIYQLWLSDVWKVWMDTLSPDERRIVKETHPDSLGIKWSYRDKEPGRD